MEKWISVSPKELKYIVENAKRVLSDEDTELLILHSYYEEEDVEHILSLSMVILDYDSDATIYFTAGGEWFLTEKKQISLDDRPDPIGDSNDPKATKLFLTDQMEEFIFVQHKIYHKFFTEDGKPKNFPNPDAITDMINWWF